MKITEPADKVIMQLLGKPDLKKDEKLRPLKWSVKLSHNKGVIFHNFLTGESIFFDGEEDIENRRDYLSSRFFLVPEDTDDLKLVEELRAALRLINKRNEITAYKILTTTDCNARCSYCYELGIEKKSMSLETADSLIEFIKKKHGGKKVRLSWFGGEPLVNTKVIDHICRAMEESGIEFVSVLTSNGYLFTPELIKRAGTKWRLSNIQITLDGTRQEYNRIKAYVGADEDPFERVIRNIKDLTGIGIRVNVRLNMGLENFEDLCKLADFLDREFEDKKYLSVYASGLFQDTEGDADPEKKKLIFKRLGELTELLYKKGLAKKSKKSLKLRLSGCMADGDNHRGISPDGALMKCEHHIFSRLAGDIYSETEDENVLNEWKTKLPYEEPCFDCPALPTCYKLKNCPVSHVCTVDERERYLESLYLALKNNLSESSLKENV